MKQIKNTVHYLLPIANKPLILLLCLLIASLLAGYQQAFTQGQGRPRVTDRAATRLKDDTLKTVTVTGRRQAIERKADRTTVNVDAFITNAGSNAWEVLEQSPGIQTTNDQISLKGKQGVTVYIDDKPTYLQGDDLVSYLKSLPASILDKIEIMSNPPAHYDAAGNGGIINIRLKKNRIKGFNGNILSENIQGRYTRLSQSLNVNLRTNKLNIYGNAAYYNGTGISHLNSLRVYAPGSNNSLHNFTQSGFAKVRNNRILLKAGIDVYCSPKTTWGLSMSHMNWDATEHRSFNGRQTYIGLLATDTLTQVDNANQSATVNNSITLNFQHVYDSAGKQLTAGMDYIRYSEGYDALTSTTAAGSGGPVSYREQRSNHQPFIIDIYAAKADYVHPLRKGFKWSMGFKSSLTHANNRVLFSTVVNEVPLPDLIMSNRFHYRENINAAYINYAAEWQKWALQVGWRIENTSLQGDQRDYKASRDTSFKRNYTNIFPTIYLSRKIGRRANQQLNFSYGKRIDRPGYTRLSPFAIPLDRYTYRIGNPYLQPQLSDNVEISWLFRNSFTAALFYNRLKDGIEETIEVRNNVFYRQPNNVSRKEVMGFSLDGSTNITPWWTVNPIIQYTWSRLSARLNNADVHVRGGNWHMAAGQQFNLPKGWTIEVSPDFSSREVYAQFIQRSTWYIHAGIGKKILKDNGTIRLNVRDIFYTRRDYQDFNNIKDVTGFNQRTWDTQSVTLLLSYRFKKGNKAARTQTGERGEEYRRLGDPQ